ncbi:hypothetical protein [Amycolatopsis vancoresmycina]|uniref:Uncharacterized protein n=1 Tax=Amycolatopsis vancoresmycina DSM 44592 TaxID=1292037 RepID=R1I0G7_9PSEU|nr:hypothetical protein [Amycolatopsis vancoresmycina]EOD69325.1 hypothetical protein H480_06978 [Amycolatopsis vancoresmycina DSM 44592]
MRSTLRGFRAAAVVALVPAGLLLAGGGSAFAAVTTIAQADTNAETFGVLGPVGLVAVALGIVGMTLGVLRQRRKTRAAAVLPEAGPIAPVLPDLPGPVTAMAEAVLADPDVTPTRPFLAQRPHA